MMDILSYKKKHILSIYIIGIIIIFYIYFNKKNTQRINLKFLGLLIIQYL